MTKNNPLLGWQVDRAAIRHARPRAPAPECVLAERDGTLWAADARGGVMRIAPDGSQRLAAPAAPDDDAAADFDKRYVLSQGSLPNGLAFLPNGASSSPTGAAIRSRS